MTAFDKDRLAAFVDGELSPEEAAAVVMHLADHPDDQAWVDDLIAANETLAAAFAAPLHEPVPEAIRSAIFGAGQDTGDDPRVVPFRPRNAARPARRGLWAAGLALAAGLAAVAVIGPTDRATGLALALGAVPAGSDMDRLLTGLASGQPELTEAGQEVMVLASLPLADGRFCREIEVLDRPAERLSLAIACTAGDGWKIEVAVAERLAADAADQGFVTAAGPEQQSLGLFLDRMGADLALDPEAEAAAIARGWTP